MGPLSAAEDWRPIPGFDGYEVSNTGRVRSERRGPWRVLAAHEERGYVRTSLWNGRRMVRPRVHQLVAAAFLGPAPLGTEVRHKDGKRSNNTPANLEHGTSSENSLDAVRHGTHNMSRKTHCKRGHEFTPENTSRFELATGSIARRCKQCQNETAKRYRARKTENRKVRAA
ncbi:NUMOD4 motif-containing HNH endonuclease [Arthrobacter sp. ok362]|uniref:NUMOD4 motif-containing HNH endonuclease n=1 Tax=Arthrobacter sp. ok362 TaxID=1761745 RepID=UPI0026767D09|nr:NUMOD4 motif-containing HNH endonuclease [Arthrobacter sp. ok362]